MNRDCAFHRYFYFFKHVGIPIPFFFEIPLFHSPHFSSLLITSPHWRQWESHVSRVPCAKFPQELVGISHKKFEKSHKYLWEKMAFLPFFPTSTCGIFLWEKICQREIPRIRLLGFEFPHHQNIKVNTTKTSPYNTNATCSHNIVSEKTQPYNLKALRLTSSSTSRFEKSVFKQFIPNVDVRCC